MTARGERTILAGDVGGTNTRLALFDDDGRELHEGPAMVLPSAAFPSLAAVVRAFLVRASARPPDLACIGIAGPVDQGRCRVTNLPWTADAGELARELGIGHVFLLNDLESMAWALPYLPADSFELIAGGESRPEANAALIAAGTGLGEAGLAWDGEQLRPFATEGGHSSFAPRGQLEIALLEYLARSLDHVSWERVLSGPGLVSIHAFLVEHRRGAVPPWLSEEMAAGDAAAAISRAALGERDPLAGEALDLFVRLYGAEAGNLALKVMARGGVYLGGGIALEILPKLHGDAFREAFCAKGRMRPLLEGIPLRVLKDDRASLLGSAQAALSLGPPSSLARRTG